MLGEQNVDSNATILSGDLDGDDGTNFTSNGENSYHVVTGSGTDVTAVLDGFSITAGNANGPGPWERHGGGMLNLSGSPTVKNCTFSGNAALWSGGAMANHDPNGNPVPSNPTLIDCIIRGNAALNGGGMSNGTNYPGSSSPTLIRCRFEQNAAGEFGGNSDSAFGGGMYNDSSSPTLTDCDFVGNRAGRAGAMYNWNPSGPILRRCTFAANSAPEGGAIWNVYRSNAVYTDCHFVENTATGPGGGVINDGASPSFVGCEFTRNLSTNGVGGMGGGGAMHNRGDPATLETVTLVNCEFRGNTATGELSRGGAISNEYEIKAAS